MAVLLVAVQGYLFLAAFGQAASLPQLWQQATSFWPFNGADSKEKEPQGLNQEVVSKTAPLGADPSFEPSAGPLAESSKGSSELIKAPSNQAGVWLDPLGGKQARYPKLQNLDHPNPNPQGTDAAEARALLADELRQSFAIKMARAKVWNAVQFAELYFQSMRWLEATASLESALELSSVMDSQAFSARIAQDIAMIEQKQTQWLKLQKLMAGLSEDNKSQALQGVWSLLGIKRLQSGLDAKHQRLWIGFQVALDSGRLDQALTYFDALHPDRSKDGQDIATIRSLLVDLGNIRQRSLRSVQWFGDPEAR